MRCLILIIVYLFVSLTVQAQNYKFRSYTASVGLPDNGVYSVFQDSKGYMWFSTDRGICSYNGVQYTTYTTTEGLVDSPARTIFEDNVGNIWITTLGGISCFNGKTFTNYTIAQGLLSNVVRPGICAKDGTLWFGTEKGLSHFDGKRFTHYGIHEGLPSLVVWSLLEDESGVLWVGLRGGGLAKFIDNQFTIYQSKDGLPDNNVFSLTKDPKQGIWIATDGGLCFFDGKLFKIYSDKEGLSNKNVSSVLIDKQGHIWCGTYGGGVNRLINGRFTTFSRNNGLPDNYITTLFQDYEGNIWCGTRWAGACLLNAVMFANYTSTKNGISDGVITGISESLDGTVWLSSINAGLSSITTNGKSTRYGVKDGLLEELLWTVFVDSQGRIWSGGQQSVSYYDGTRFRSFTVQEMGTSIRIVSITEDRQGRIWFANDSGLSKGLISYDGQKFVTYSTKEGLNHNQVNSFFIDNQGKLVACTENGLSRFEGDHFVDISPWLPNKHVTCAYEDENNQLWVGTVNGLFCFSNSQVTAYYMQDGLVFNGISSIKGQGNNIWIGTTKGISVFDGKYFHTYTVKDGLISDDISSNDACLLKKDGTIWFGTSGGVIRCNPSDINIQTVAPYLQPPTIKVNDKQVDIINEKLGEFSVKNLAYYENSITFELNSPSFIDESAICYSYYLQGFDNNWSSPKNERFVRFTNLSSGSYSFYVKARSSTGVWSDPKIVKITIDSPYWRTWWFGGILVSTVLLLAYLIYTRRVYKLKRDQEMSISQIRQVQEQRVATLRQLLESIRIINSQLELTTVLQSIAEEGARLIDGEPGGIGLVVDNSKVVFKRLWLNDHWEDSNLQFEIGEGVAGRVAATSEPIIVNDPKNSPIIAFPEMIEKFYVNGLMDVPILSRNGEVVGVLDVRRKQGAPIFTETDCQLIGALANQAAIAIENAALYGELGAKNEELKEKNTVIGESITELENLYEQERDVTHKLQELDQMKTNFMIVMSHEIRTPLTVLKGYNDALIEGCFGQLSASQKQSIQACQGMVDRMVASFNDILEMLRINEGRMSLKPSVLNFNELIRQIIQNLSTFVEQRKQHLTFESPVEVEISADPEKIQLVLVNVIQNSIKFTPDGGNIRVYLKVQGDMAHITVEDTGIGIEAKEIERIFEKFYTSPDTSTHTSGKFEFSARGTGLGLSIARSYVEAHGGRIWASSAGLGRGSCFHIILPLINKIKEVDTDNVDND